jgi:hypothetical protein
VARRFWAGQDPVGKLIIQSEPKSQTTLLVVGVAMPTPGAIGGFHAMYQITVTKFFGVPVDRAVGAAIVLHAISFVPVTLLGIVFMAREGLSLARMRKMAEEERRELEAAR